MNSEALQHLKYLYIVDLGYNICIEEKAYFENETQIAVLRKTLTGKCGFLEVKRESRTTVMVISICVTLFIGFFVCYFCCKCI
jgi:hypothetical protein